jgi:diaminohydroxyphosphoribosylaminopyrimidine deaminase/5-amino-6-(5-phosphoribosylamino)uracil reductase
VNAVNVHEKYMLLAIELAKSAKGQTNPNPMVGAVVVNNSQIVGMGAHLRAGEAHAEVHALEMAKEKAKGATMYVTLEPCSHYGRTPPCVDKVIDSGIKMVFVATLDPNPLVAGRGVKKLQDAGIEVKVGLLQSFSDKMNEVFNYYIIHKQPFVTLKTATTLDGKIATVIGESKWITNEESRKDVHLLRHQHDAIVVGVNTVIKDNPQLTTRIQDDYDQTVGKNPIRIILDSTLRTPLDSHILNTELAETWIFTSQQVTQEEMKPFEAKNVRVLQTSDPQKVSIPEVLSFLGGEQVASLLVEGGGEINSAFLLGGHVNKIVSYIAPTFIGGNEAPTSFRGEGVTRLADAIQLKDVKYSMLGEDIKMIGYVK